VKGLPQLVILDGPGALCSSKVAGFDIDWTIIKTKSGRKFPTGLKDREFLHDCVPAKLKELHDGGTKVVFFTNQAGIEKQKITIKELGTKFEAIINAIGVPIQVFMCTGNSHYRKPSVEMWQYMETTNSFPWKCIQHAITVIAHSFFLACISAGSLHGLYTCPMDKGCSQ